LFKIKLKKLKEITNKIRKIKRSQRRSRKPNQKRSQTKSVLNRGSLSFDGKKGMKM